MSPQHLMAVDFKEVRNITISCKCGASVTMPLPQHNLPEHMRCFGCGQQMWGGQEDQRFIRILGLARSLTNWQQLEQKDVIFGLSIIELAKA